VKAPPPPPVAAGLWTNGHGFVGARTVPKKKQRRLRAESSLFAWWRHGGSMPCLTNCWTEAIFRCLRSVGMYSSSSLKPSLASSPLPARTSCRLRPAAGPWCCWSRRYVAFHCWRWGLVVVYTIIRLARTVPPRLYIAALVDGHRHSSRWTKRGLLLLLLILPILVGGWRLDVKVPRPGHVRCIDQRHKIVRFW
jgi:hypothetical protein